MTDHMPPGQLRREISDYLKLSISDAPVSFQVLERVDENGLSRLRISYPAGDGEVIPAYLLLPDGTPPFGAVLVHHQHHGQRHLGKSEVCGLAGDPLQAFGPALARRGIVVLAPDSICFEDRRRNRTGIEPDKEADDDQHYNEMCFRLLRGDTLMRKVLSDSAAAISMLRSYPLVDPRRVGIMGHSYGGNTVLFHTALDERIAFACSSGAACTYQFKMGHHYGIEMAEVIPGFAERFDIPDLVTCFAPRWALIVSATQDAASQDAERIVADAHSRCTTMGLSDRVEHWRFEGEHALTPERFEAILDWLVDRSRSVT